MRGPHCACSSADRARSCSQPPIRLPAYPPRRQSTATSRQAHRRRDARLRGLEPAGPALRHLRAAAFSGSESLERAIDWVLAEMKKDGLENVRGRGRDGAALGARGRVGRAGQSAEAAAADARPGRLDRHAGQRHHRRRAGGRRASTTSRLGPPRRVARSSSSTSPLRTTAPRCSTAAPAPSRRRRWARWPR